MRTPAKRGIEWKASNLDRFLHPTSCSFADQVQILIDGTSRVRVDFDVREVILNDTEKADEFVLREEQCGLSRWIWAIDVRIH